MYEILLMKLSTVQNCIPGSEISGPFQPVISVTGLIGFRMTMLLYIAHIIEKCKFKLHGMTCTTTSLYITKNIWLRIETLPETARPYMLNVIHDLWTSFQPQ